MEDEDPSCASTFPSVHYQTRMDVIHDGTNEELFVEHDGTPRFSSLHPVFG